MRLIERPGGGGRGLDRSANPRLTFCLTRDRTPDGTWDRTYAGRRAVRATVCVRGVRCVVAWPWAATNNYFVEANVCISAINDRCVDETRRSDTQTRALKQKSNKREALEHSRCDMLAPLGTLSGCPRSQPRQCCREGTLRASRHTLPISLSPLLDTTGNVPPAL